MYLKRKRSDSEISTTSSLLSSPLHDSNAMLIDTQSIRKSNLFSSRTRKRHRDNRPNEECVHQHTLSLLYSAQHQPSLSTHASAPVAPIPSRDHTSHQASLHSFWHLPPPRHSYPGSDSNSPASSSDNTPTTIVNPHLLKPTNCEDCDASLDQKHDDEMDIDMMMDIDRAGEGSHACTSCGKMVCRSCAVSNLGMDRKCLGCAGRSVAQGGKRWVGGLGWMV